MEKSNIESKFINGLRVTDQKIINIVEKVLIEFNKDIVESLNNKSSEATQLNSKTSSVINVVPENKELGFVGIPKRIIVMDISKEENEKVVEETTQDQTVETVDESKFESAGDDSVIKVDLSKPIEPEQDEVKEDNADDSGVVELVEDADTTEKQEEVQPEVEAQETPTLEEVVVEETTEEKSYTNHPQDKYQQYRFDSRKISYFIDSDGYFVARFNEAYDYTTEGPK